jgi:hypothetical protein
MMRFYNQQHRFYCGVDLHARTLSLHILAAIGRSVLAKTIAANPALRARAVDPWISVWCSDTLPPSSESPMQP